LTSGLNAESDFPRIWLSEEAEAAGCDTGSASGVADWITRERDRLRASVARQGALLLRGFSLETADDFDSVVQAFGYGDFSYANSLSNAVRIELTSRVFTANEAPPSEIIHLHHELAQTPSSPTHILLFCAKPAQRGGATVICRSDWLFSRLLEERPDFARACEERGFVYTVRMPAEDDAESGQGRSWCSTFGVDSKRGAEAEMARLGYTWAWEEGDALAASGRVR